MFMAHVYRHSLKSWLPWLALSLSLALLVGNILLNGTLLGRRALLASAATSPEPVSADSSAGPAPLVSAQLASVVELAEGKWKSAGIRTEPARLVELPEEVGVTGKVEANTDHRVEVRPRAPGILREVPVRLGQKVKQGDVLAVLDSPDIGTARLNLRSRQIELATARIEMDWKRQVANNVAELIPAIRRNDPATRLQREYADRPLGNDRALLLQTYSEFEIAAHEAQKTLALHKDKIIGEHPATVAAHTLEGVQAKLEAVLEQVRYDATHNQVLAEQKVRLAESAVVDAAQRLRILGISTEIDELLANAGEVAASKSNTTEDVTAYPIHAPIDGTVISKSAVMSEQADATTILFVVADLRNVWVTANVGESELIHLSALEGGEIRVTLPAFPDRSFQARLLSVGSVVDPATRTVPFLAETDNPDGLLRLGMFARIVLDSTRAGQLLCVPTSAVVEIEGQSGVFLPREGAPRTYTFHPVEVGREAEGSRVVLDGLSQGQEVVSAGAYLLKSELLLQNETEED